MLEKLICELKRQKRIHGLKETVSPLEIQKLKQQMPIQKIIGFINFDNLIIKLNRKVFIPRYETEEVVNYALKYINKQSRVLDLCCGSGYIGLTIKQKTNASVVLADNDDEAIMQTKENARLNNLDVQIIKSNLFENVQGKFDVIISNPPYIPRQTQVRSAVKNFEPTKAIFGGKDGNKFYKKIINNLKNHLNPNGYVIFEIAPQNSPFLAANGFKV